MHMVQHNVRVARQERWCHGTTELQSLIRAVGVTDVSDRDQHGVRQPGQLHRCSEMSQCTLLNPIKIAG
jgi:hypothetical protein